MNKKRITLPAELITDHISPLAPSVPEDAVEGIYQDIFSDVSKMDNGMFVVTLPDSWSIKEDSRPTNFFLLDEFNNQRMEIYAAKDIQTAFLYSTVFAYVTHARAPHTEENIDVIKLHAKGMEQTTATGIPYSTETEIDEAVRHKIYKILNQNIETILNKEFPDRANPQSIDWRNNITDRVNNVSKALEELIKSTKQREPKLAQKMAPI